MKKGNFEAVFQRGISIVLIQSISHYLESHKRLVVPQLGAFIVKEPGRSILFSELLKRDDGVLRGLLRDAGMTELEAAGEIDRFVFEVRHAVQGGAAYPLKGFGTLKPGPNGTIAFDYDPAPEEAEPAEKPADGNLPVPDAAPTTPSGVLDPGTPAVPHRSDPLVSEKGPAKETPATAGNPRSHSSRIPADRLARSVERAFAEPYVSPSAKMNPDPSVRGLRYGKPPKTTDAYTYVDRPTRRRADRFLWIAIAAAIIALAAIGFGYWRERHDRAAAEAEYMEYRQQIESPTTSLENAPEVPESAQPVQAE